jgi:hypothetical protein
VTAVPALPVDPATEAGCVLLVVDYAENQAEALSDLLGQLINPAVDLEVELTDRVRVLLLARHHHDWWPQLARDHPDHAWVDPTPVRLPALTDELQAGNVDSVWAHAISEVVGSRWTRELLGLCCCCLLFVPGRDGFCGRLVA